MRAKEKQMKKLLVAAASIAIALQSGAAVITWGSATGLSADTDVSTLGSLFLAEAVNANTINGVSFGGIGSSGNLTLSGSANQYAAVPAQPGLSGAYSNFTQGVTWDPSDLYTITIDNLTVGQDYLVQIWTANGWSDAQEIVTYDDGNGSTVALAANPGHFTIGTFTADATSQSFTETTANPGDDNPFFNGVQIRAIPEPASLGMIGLGAGLLLACRRFLWS